MSDEAAPGPGRRNLILATCCLSLFLVSLDVTIVNVALPSIRRDLHASVTELQWTLDAYTLCVASFLMLAGSTADRVGRKRTFQVGTTVFGLGSLLCGLAPSTTLLVGARILQALGGAMLNPVAMSIVVNTFTDPKERARAIGVWGGVFGVSMALGPLVGGALVQSVGWRAVFVVNVPVVIVALILTARFVPESRAEHPRRPDPVGQGLVLLTLFTTVGALIEGPRQGWGSPLIIGAFVLASVAVAALIAHESRRHEPLLDLRFFRSVPFAAATLTAVCAFASFSGFLFLNSLYLQEARSLGALAAGLCTLPIALVTVIGSPLSGRLVAAGRVRLALASAGIAIALGSLMLTQLHVDTPLPLVLASYAVFGCGLGLVNAPITNAAVSGMPRAQAGLAAGIASTSRQIGASLGVAVAGSVAGRGVAHTSPEAFTASTHPVFWIVVGLGLGIVALGLAATSDRGQASARRVAAQLGD